MTVIPTASIAESRELTSVDFATLEFTNAALAERIQRIDKLGRIVGLPVENAIVWSRRPANAKDGRKLASYVAQWSTHRMDLGDAIQPNQRPGQRICVIADVNPGDGKSLCGFQLIADWRPREEGWNASIHMFTFQPYRKDIVGQERLRIWLERSDVSAHLDWPFSGWSATVPIERRDALQAGTVAAMETVRQPPDLEETVTLLASPESFLNGLKRELNATERRSLDDIARSRNICVGRIGTVVTSRTSIPESSCPQFQEIEMPADFELTAAEKQVFKAHLTDWIQSRHRLSEENYEEMYAAILKAFPIDAYFAAEAKTRTDVDWLEN